MQKVAKSHYMTMQEPKGCSPDPRPVGLLLCLNVRQTFMWGFWSGCGCPRSSNSLPTADYCMLMLGLSALPLGVG